MRKIILVVALFLIAFPALAQVQAPLVFEVTKMVKTPCEVGLEIEVAGLPAESVRIVVMAFPSMVLNPDCPEPEDVVTLLEFNDVQVGTGKFRFYWTGSVNQSQLWVQASRNDGNKTLLFSDLLDLTTQNILEFDQTNCPMDLLVYTQLSDGSFAVVSDADPSPLPLRSKPGLKSRILAQIPVLEMLPITGQPQCEADWIWWNTEYNGVSGVIGEVGPERLYNVYPFNG